MKDSRLTSTIAIILSILTFSACSNTDKAVTDRDASASASYRITLNTFWDATTFPVNFPASAHFSAMVGGTHNEQIIFWETGQLASDGIERMAESGTQGSLVSEVEAAKNEGKAQFVLGGPGAGAVESVSFEFDINPEYPLVSLVSMVAPSPDWFVGVQNLSLYDTATNDWKPSVTVDLAVYDAGTDSGLRFESADSNAQPASGISRLSSKVEDTDFVNGIGTTGQYIARFTFELIN